MAGRLKLAGVLAAVILAVVLAAAVIPHSSPVGPPPDPPRALPEPAGQQDAGDRPEPVPADPVEPEPVAAPAPPEPADPSGQYVRARHDWYEMDVPAGWVLPPENPLFGAAADLLFAEVSGGEAARFVPHTYVEPGSVFEVIPTTLDVRATGTALSLEEFAASESEVMTAIGVLLGMDIRQTGSSPVMLGSNPGVVSEYRVDAGPSAVFAVSMATTVVDGVAYTISYTADNEAYQDGLVHLGRAAESFVAVPSGLPAYLTAPPTGGNLLQVPDMAPRPGPSAGTVTRVVDGDTIDISGERYRLSLVDTPERGEPGFAEATEEVSGLCPVGSVVLYDGDDITPTDRYGRHLGVVWCAGNGYAVSVGEHLWRAGLAEFYYEFCGTSEAATVKWAAVHGWFYHDMCSGRPAG